MNKNILPPTRKKLITFAALWAVGLVLTITAQTDLFREPLFQRKNFSVFFLVLLSPTMLLLAQVVAYRKSKQRNGARP